MARGMEPTWIKNFDVYSQTAKVLNLAGNIEDIYMLQNGDNYTYCNMKDWLHKRLESPTEQLFYYSPIYGLCDHTMLMNPEETSEAVRDFIRQGRGNAKDFPSLAGLLSSICRRCDREKSFSIVFPSASRLVVNSRSLSEAEHKAFTVLLESVRESNKRDRLVFLADNLCDLPDFMTRESADIRNIHVTIPDQLQRKQYMAKLFPEFSAKACDKLADAADNMNICEIQRMTTLIQGAPSPKGVQEAIEQYKFGHKDNPWMDMDREKALALEPYLQSVVFGQDEAIQKISRKIVKAQTGVKRAFNNRKSRRPVGVCVLVGPTGTGKTLLVKKVAEHVFGSEDAMIRFDMAEYQTPHNAERLKGAPPGYVGYSEGGQLTNAVKAKPHCILLFDEIEKAHPDVLTMLLGVLEDGVLTSGRGETVSFANCFIVFTSNLGAAESAAADDNEEAKEIIMRAIHRHFYETIGRPEILGRFERDNAITVFNRLGAEVTENILESELKQAKENFKMQSNIELVWTKQVIHRICDFAAERESGANGRAVLAALDTFLEDPLADLYAEKEIVRNVRIEIQDIVEENGAPRLVCQVTPIAVEVDADRTGASGRVGGGHITHMNRVGGNTNQGNGNSVPTGGSKLRRLG
ncbi:MAG: ATP-dependent Clp protease ATP-binding subunit [Lachnospiraceae bacterium]|nr:ATP-dependent Clp protease ATP-binding subunit [Lachnospiraceae bacterium]